MVSWETVVEEASMPPLVLTPIQSGQGLPDCVYSARLVFARTFSLWKHHNLILVPRSTPGKSDCRTSEMLEAPARECYGRRVWELTQTTETRKRGCGYSLKTRQLD